MDKTLNAKNIDLRNFIGNDNTDNPKSDLHAPRKKPEKTKWTQVEVKIICAASIIYFIFQSSYKDTKLINAVQESGGKNWKQIAGKVFGKTEVQCLHRWTKVLNPKLTKGPWTEEV